MTLEQAKTLDVRHVRTVHSVVDTNADGTPQRWQVNGEVKTWKRNPERVRVPIKRGMYEYGYITESNLNMFEEGEGR